VFGLAVPSISTDCSFFIRRVRQSKKNGLLGCEHEGSFVLQNAGNCVANKRESFSFSNEAIRCTLLISIFILTSLHVLGNYVPINRRTFCIYATLVFFTLVGWLG